MPFDEAMATIQTYAGGVEASAIAGTPRPGVFLSSASYADAIDTIFDTAELNAAFAEEIAAAAGESDAPGYSKISTIRLLRQIGLMSACRRDLRAQFLAAGGAALRSADKRRRLQYGMSHVRRSTERRRDYLCDDAAAGDDAGGVGGGGIEGLA